MCRLQARSIDKPVNFVVDVKDVSYDLERLEYAKLGGKGSTLAFLGDSKSYVRASLTLSTTLILISALSHSKSLRKPSFAQ